MRRPHLQENPAPRLLLLLALLLVLATLAVVMGEIFARGGAVISWSFLTEVPREGMTAGGILPAIIGTSLLTLITALVCLPVGIACAIYLNEYARDTWVTRTIRAAIRNLAGVPSIIYGLFGLALFVQALNVGTSLIAAGFTLGLLSLPYVITTTEEALKTVPRSVREGALALGATQFESIRDVVLPAAVPGIATGAILSLSRAAGETAPILFTGAAYYVTGSAPGLFQEFMALPYHLYMLATQHQSIMQVRPLAFGTAAVLIILVTTLNVFAMFIRMRYRRRIV